MPETHRHRPKTTREALYAGPVAHPENEAAHGNIVSIAICRCGAEERAIEYDDEDSDGGEQVAYWRAQRERRQEQRHAQLDKAKASMDETTAGVAGLGLQLVRKSEYHYHVLRGREVIAQWWPSSGKTMDGQRRGQVCRTGKALVAWLRDKQLANARSHHG